MILSLSRAHAESFRIPAGRCGPLRTRAWEKRGRQLLFETQPRVSFSPITQVLFTFTPSHLAISQIDDVSNWKAWNILDESTEKGGHTSLLPLAQVPKGKKEKEKGGGREGLEPWFWKKNKAASFGSVCAVWSLRGSSISHSFLLEGPGVKSEDRYTSLFVPRFERMIAAFFSVPCFGFEAVIFF